MQDGFDFLGFAFISKCQKNFRPGFWQRKSNKSCQNWMFLKKINLPKTSGLQFFQIMATNWTKIDQKLIFCQITHFLVAWAGRKRKSVSYVNLTQAKFVSSVTFEVFLQKWMKFEWFSMKYDISISFYHFQSRKLKFGGNFTESQISLCLKFFHMDFWLFTCCFSLRNEMR